MKKLVNPQTALALATLRRPSTRERKRVIKILRLGARNQEIKTVGRWMFLRAIRSLGKKG